MLKPGHAQSGVTLVELMISVAIMGIVLAMGISGFSSWIRNSKVRTTAESIKNGLQLARAEVVRRNTLVRFQLTTTAGNDCQLSNSDANWVVSLTDPTNLCATAPSDTVPPQIIQMRPAAEGSGQASVVATEVTSAGVAVPTPAFVGGVTFNGLGRVVTNPPVTTIPPPVPVIDAGSNVNIDVSYQIDRPKDRCVLDGGEIRCLRVVVTNGGQIRMCDPKLPNTDAQGC